MYRQSVHICEIIAVSCDIGVFSALFCNSSFIFAADSVFVGISYRLHDEYSVVKENLTITVCIAIFYVFVTDIAYDTDIFNFRDDRDICRFIEESDSYNISRFVESKISLVLVRISTAELKRTVLLKSY